MIVKRHTALYISIRMHVYDFNVQNAPKGTWSFIERTRHDSEKVPKDPQEKPMCK